MSKINLIERSYSPRNGHFTCHLRWRDNNRRWGQSFQWAQILWVLPLSGAKVDSVENWHDKQDSVLGENRTKPLVGQNQQAPGSRAAVKQFVGRIREKASPQMSFQLHNVSSTVASFPPTLSCWENVERSPADTIRDNRSERLIHIIKRAVHIQNVRVCKFVHNRVAYIQECLVVVD